MKLGTGIALKGHQAFQEETSWPLPFLLAIPTKDRQGNNQELFVLPPSKMCVSSVVFRSFVKFLLLFYNSTLD